MRKSWDLKKRARRIKNPSLYSTFHNVLRRPVICDFNHAICDFNHATMRFETLKW